MYSNSAVIALLALLQCYTLISGLSKTNPSTKSSTECHLLCKCHYSTTSSYTGSEKTFQTECISSFWAAVEYSSILDVELACWISMSISLQQLPRKTKSHCLSPPTFSQTLFRRSNCSGHMSTSLPPVMSTLFHNPHTLWKILFSIRSHAVKRLSFREAGDPLSKYIPSLLCRHLLALVLWNIYTVCCPTLQLSLQQWHRNTSGVSHSL